MRRIKVDANSVEPEKLQIALDVIKKGGVIVYPTETVYGLGASIFDEKAVLRVYEIKKRDRNRPISMALSDAKEIEKYAYIADRGFIRDKLPGPVTVLLRKRNTVPDYVSKEKIGIRIPEYPTIRRLIELSGPITSTSANISGKKAPFKFEDVEVDADLGLDAGETKYKKPSRVIDLTTGEWLR